MRPCDNCGRKLERIFYIARMSIAIFTATFRGRSIHGDAGARLALVELVRDETAAAVTVASERDQALELEVHVCAACYTQPLNLSLLAERIAIANTRQALA